MGRPTKAEARRKALGKNKEKNGVWGDRSDAEVLSTIHERFDVMHRMTQGVLRSNVRGFIVSGSAGVGKTYNVETALHDREEELGPDKFRYKIIKGAVSPIHLYKTLWNYQRPQDIVVLDDADSIFFHDDGVSLLKAALDSSPRRVITWASEASLLKQEDIPDTYEYQGGMIFITNTDFQGIIDEGKSKLVPHFEALLSRAMYLDLMIHDRRGAAIWVNYLVKAKKILQIHMDLTKDQEAQAVDWLLDHREDLRTLSIRDALKIGQLMKADYSNWESSAEILLLREMKS